MANSFISLHVWTGSSMVVYSLHGVDWFFCGRLQLHEVDWFCGLLQLHEVDWFCGRL